MSAENRCVCCGQTIPEGTQVCKPCEQAACLHVWVFDGLDFVKGKRMIRSRCMICGARRTEIPVARIPLDEDGKKHTGLLEEE